MLLATDFSCTVWFNSVFIPYYKFHITSFIINFYISVYNEQIYLYLPISFHKLNKSLKKYLTLNRDTAIKELPQTVNLNQNDDGFIFDVKHHFQQRLLSKVLIFARFRTCTEPESNSNNRYNMALLENKNKIN